MQVPVEGTTFRLQYDAEIRDGTGVVSSGTDVHLKIHNITDNTWWTGSTWDVETELTASHFTNGSWYYDLSIPSGDAGDEIQWVFYNETDGTYIKSGSATIRGSATLALSELTDILADETAFNGADVDAAISSRATVVEILADETAFNGADIDAAISGRATVAGILDALGCTTGAISGTGSTTTEFDTDLTEATNDHYIGCLLVFTSGALQGQFGRVLDYVGSSGTITLAQALTEAPADTDEFVLVPVGVDVWATDIATDPSLNTDDTAGFLLALLAGRIAGDAEADTSTDVVDIYDPGGTTVLRQVRVREATGAWIQEIV